MATIYKIWSEKGDKVYIGSTIMDIKKRWNNHLASGCDTNSRLLFEEYGKDACKIEIIEEVKEDVRLERERHWIEFYGTHTINARVPIRSFTERKEKYKKYATTRAKWAEKNKDSIIQKRKEWEQTVVVCQCGETIKKVTLYTHLRSKKHLSKVNLSNE